jgi:hypothetical protein
LHGHQYGVKPVGDVRTNGAVMTQEEPPGSVADGLEEGVADPGLVELLVTGSAASGDFRCADCGYGAVVQRELPVCPMCGGTVWARSRSLRARPPADDPLR